MKKKQIVLLIAIACCSGKVLIVDSLNYQANDFAPIYIAAALLAEGKSAAIYDHHPYFFNTVPPGIFKETAEKFGFRGMITPYVHFPLFAFLTRPLLAIPYSTITKLLLMINVCAVLFSLYLIIRLTGMRCNLAWIICALAALTFFYPLLYSLRLGQTTPLVFLGVTALYSAYKNGYPKLSGVILGGVICLKITPLALLIYFIVKKKWSLVVSSGCAIVCIVMASVLVMGWEINSVFANNIIRLSGYSLASWNNQSLDGFLLRLVTGGLHLYDWHILTLPSTITMLKYGIVSLLVVIWLIAVIVPKKIDDNQELLAFSLTVTLMVMLSPISWTHYLVFLFFPYFVLLSALIRNNTVPFRRFMIGGLLLAYSALALPPSYVLKLLNVPLVNAIPLFLLSSTGFSGGMLVMGIILFSMLFNRQADRAFEE